jgi:hypothetical protein
MRKYEWPNVAFVVCRRPKSESAGFYVVSKSFALDKNLEEVVVLHAWAAVAFCVGKR